MERVGILIVAYGSREVAMVDAFSRSNSYGVEFYIVDRQRNPFNEKMAEGHIVVPDLNVDAIAKFARRHRSKIDFGIVGPEAPIISGLRDRVEGETDIPIIGPTQRYALEVSKVRQRLLLQEVAPEVNPRFRVFNPQDYREKGRGELIRGLKAWIETLGGVGGCVIKPDRPGFGKGVGVGGEHFFTTEQAIGHFLSLYMDGRERVIVEEKIEGEESSFQAWCDGKRLSVLPETRDYKRAFDGDKGPNTGGMGSYKDTEDLLPFMVQEDREEEIRIVNRIFKELRSGESNPELRGMPFYVAVAHTGKGPKFFEINSRPGDPEIQCLLPVLCDDFVDICFRMIDGRLSSIKHESQAAVVTYVVPDVYPGKDRRVREVDLSEAYGLRKRYGDQIKVYPASMGLRDGKTYALTSRTVCIVGIADDLQTAREISLEGVKAVKGEALRYRKDIASRGHIKRSVEHMKRLRGR